MHTLLYFLTILFSLPCFASFEVPEYKDTSITTLPVFANGRCRPLEAHARQLLHYFYERDSFSNKHVEHFTTSSPTAVEWLIDLTYNKNSDWNTFPLFYYNGTYYSYNALKQTPILELEEKITFYENKQFLHLFPDKSHQQWLSLDTLTNTYNATLYSDAHYKKIQTAYHRLHFLPLADTLQKAYLTIEGTTYLQSKEKHLFYPFKWQLTLETLYFQWPWIEICLTLYILALLTAFYSLKRKKLNKYSWLFFITAFLLQTFLLIMRCLILERPPVSNMFETVLYVPWVASLITLILPLFIPKTTWCLIAASLANITLQYILKFYSLDHDMEPLQAVLDSQYWLLIHVLMVVGSYGLFFLAGILAHFWMLLETKSALVARNTKGTLSLQAINPRKKLPPPSTPKPPPALYQTLIQSLYIGSTLLIAGTLLGGVWAAESWGRFWDWDPKESWAFISACFYLVIIHAHRYKILSPFFLSAATILGMLLISFTWYGVNYILGTGLHSYGFGTGGIQNYLIFLGIEIIFILIMCSLYIYLQKTKKII